MTKSSSIGVLAVCLLLAVGGLYWWLDNEHDAAPPALPQSDLAVVAKPATADVEVAAGVDASFDEWEEGPADLMRIDVSSPEGEASKRLIVQVWDRKQGTPAAEADVYLLTGFDREQLRDPFAPHVCELAIEHGKRFRAGSDGRVEMTSPTDWSVLAATLPGASGFEVIGRRRGDLVTVTLRAEETVTVKVVDERGRAVEGAPVGLLQRVPERVDWDQLSRDWKELEGLMNRLERRAKEKPSDAGTAERLASVRRRRDEMAERFGALKAKAANGQKGKGATAKAPKSKGAKGKQSNSKQARAQQFETKRDLRARRRTDARGFAVFRHFQHERASQKKWWPKQHRDRFEAALLMPMAKVVKQAFAGRPVPEDVIELVMPPTGGIALRAVDRDGRPFTHPVRGELRALDGASPGWSRLSIRKEQDEATVLFPFVGLGMQFQANCRLDDDDFSWRSPTFAGPTDSGEVVTVDLVVAPDAGMLHGRVLGVEGEPMRSAEVTFLINSLRGRLEGEDVQLDAEGRFHLPYKVRDSQQPPFRLQVRDKSRVPVPGLAVTLGVLPKARVLDVGDLRVDWFSRIAHGVVVDDRGEPLEGATVQLQREREVGGRQPRLAFRDEAYTRAMTDSDGQFDVFGDLEHARYRLRASVRDHFPHESQGVSDKAPMVLRLDRKARVVGTVLLPKWMRARDVKVRLLSLDDPSRNRDDQIHGYRGKQHIYFDWVRPGGYDIELRVAAFPDPFLRIRGVQIAPGQTGMHPRLTDLDLGGYLFRYEISAVDEAGEPMRLKEALLARIVRPSGESGFVGFPWRKGRAVIISTTPQLEVFPMARGYRVASGVVTPGESSLRFLRVPPLQLRVPGLRNLLGETSGWLGMSPVGNGPEMIDPWDRQSRRTNRTIGRQQSAYARIDGELIDVSPARDGRYQVSALLGDKRRGGLVSVPLGEVEVQLVPGSGPQQLTVGFDPQAVQRGVAEVAQLQAASANGNGK